MLLSQGIPPDGSACARSDGGPVETDGRRSGARSPTTGTCSAAPRRDCGWSRRFATSSASTPLRADTPTRSTTCSPSSWPSRSSGRGRCSAVQPGGARHHRVAAGRPGRARQAGRRRLGAGRVITTFRPDDVVDLRLAGWADRVDRARRDHRLGHVNILRVPGSAAASGGRSFIESRRHVLRPRSPDRAHARRSTRTTRLRLFKRGCAARRPPRTRRRSGRTC